MGAVVILLFLLLLGWLAYGLWIGLYNNKQDGDINDMRTNMTIIQQDIMQLILEFQGAVTVLQTGNVSWVLSDPLGDGNHTSMRRSNHVCQSRCHTCVAGVNVCLIEFTPTVAALDVYNTNPGQAPITNVFTTTNRARMSVTPDCLSTLHCVIYPQLVETTSIGAAEFVNKFILDRVAIAYYLREGCYVCSFPLLYTGGCSTRYHHRSVQVDHSRT